MTPDQLAALYPNDGDAARMAEEERMRREGICLHCKGTGYVRRTRAAGGGLIGCRTWREPCLECRAVPARL